MEAASLLSSLSDEAGPAAGRLEPHYRESYRVAVDALVERGAAAYRDCLAQERLPDFLAEEEVEYILRHVQRPAAGPDGGGPDGPDGDDDASSGTYWPLESDVEAPDLDLGWPYVLPGLLGGTQVELLFHPPRAHPLTVKETVRKMIKDARKVIALVMDIFTDVDIFKEIVEASTRGVSVYILLDESNFGHFLKMTERQGCQVQRLRNIRVRTVKGQDYLSKTGAKFHGKLEQKFLLVDCQKVLYGSYSYMWSFEKAHVSMAQLISGQLVESFDEEFRTLYARSCVPRALAPEAPARARPGAGRARWENGLGPRSGVSSLASLSSRPAGAPRADPGLLPPRGLLARHERDRYSVGTLGYQPHLAPLGNGPHAPRAFPPGPPDGHRKRHSYAGEPTEAAPFPPPPGRAPPRPGPPPGPWARPADALSLSAASSSRGGAPSLGRAERRAERGAPARRSFHGTDSHVRRLQQRMPTLERTTRSFLRTWRLESYLNDRADAAAPAPDAAAPAALLAHSRLRASFVFKPTLPEQREGNSGATGSSNSTVVGSQGGAAPAEPPAPPAPPPTPPAPPGAHGPAAEPAPRAASPAPAEQLLKRRSFPSFELARAGVEPGGYGTLTRARARARAPEPPRAEPLKGARSLHDVARGPEEAPAPGEAGEAGARGPPPPGRAAATKAISIAALLDAHREEPPGGEPSPRREGRGSPSFLKKGSQKLRSLLSLTPERRDGLARSKAPAFYRLCGSSESLASEGGEDARAPRRAPAAPAAPASPAPGGREDLRAAPREPPRGPAPPAPGPAERTLRDRPGDASAPRFNTEQMQFRDARAAPAPPRPPPPAQPLPRARAGELLRSHSAHQRVYSRFEPFCRLEGAAAPGSAPRAPASASSGGGGGYGPGRASPLPGYAAGARGLHAYPPGGENKFRGFMHKFGNLIHKSK
ncbi:protein FAM83B [Perognathus longimembris pacificus]|uniref:protein FAM83B n=1 Tax=Perognathus longimembris pacificus TaxID=214514 RepID=UPI002018F458|nr:protein FAM83B [Perognathus longimembris pacificus]